MKKKNDYVVDINGNYYFMEGFPSANDAAVAAIDSVGRQVYTVSVYVHEVDFKVTRELVVT